MLPNRGMRYIAQNTKFTDVWWSQSTEASTILADARRTTRAQSTDISKIFVENKFDG